MCRFGVVGGFSYLGGVYICNLKYLNARILEEHGATWIFEDVVGPRSVLILHPGCTIVLAHHEERSRSIYVHQGRKYATRLANRLASLTFLRFGSP